MQPKLSYDFLSEIRGRLRENVALGEQSWFRCGGSADLVYEPADIEDLQSFLKAWPKHEPLNIVGKMANTIVRDGGLRGCTIQFGKAMSSVEIIDGERIAAQAGALNGTVCAAAVKNSIGGLEFLSGVPGSIGGAVAMNAGAYGAEVKDVLVNVKALERQGALHVLSAHDLQMGYRHTKLPEGMVIVSALFKGQLGKRDQLKAHLQEIKRKRNETQPIKDDTGGSTFANPKPQDLKAARLREDMRAWEIVDAVGGRGLKIGGAQMSEKHCNFMINTGDATAADLEALGDELILRAQEKFGLTLHWEIKRIGERV